MVDDVFRYARRQLLKGDAARALASGKKVTEAMPPSKRQYMLAFLNFCAGNLDEAFHGLHFRHEADGMGRRLSSSGIWMPPMATDQTLIWAPAGIGIGAEAMHLGFLAGMDFDGALVLDPRLMLPALEIAPRAKVYSRDEPVPDEYRAHASLLSAGWIRKSRKGSYSRPAGYLKAQPDRAAEAKARLRAHFGDDRPVVGVSWSGGVNGARVNQPDLIMAEVQKAQTAGKGVMSLQHVPPPDVQENFSVEGVFFDSAIGGRAGFGAYLGYIAACESITTVENSLAHFAGAMATPVTVIRTELPSWEWWPAFSQSFWYPGVHFAPLVGEAP